MKKFVNIILVLCSSILMFSCDQDDNETSVIKGKISGFKGENIYVSKKTIAEFAETGDEENIVDTISVKGGKFKYDVETTETLFIKLLFESDLTNNFGGHVYYPETEYINLVFHPGDRISIKGKLKKGVINYSVKGNESSISLSEIRKKYSDILVDKVKNEVETFDIYFNGIEGKTDEEISIIFEEVYAKFQDIQKLVSQKEKEYLEANYEKEISAYLTSLLPLDEFGMYYDKLSDEIKNGTFKLLLDKRNESYIKFLKKKEIEESLKEGSKAPNFKLTSINGNEFELSSISDKYVILDFWASWCGYCIKAFPEMKQYYEKYSDKFEIIGIACNDKDEDWRESVSENELPWLQVKNNDDNTDLNVATMYGVSGFPSMFLLDKDKNIVMKSVGFNHDMLDKLDELFAK